MQRTYSRTKLVDYIVDRLQAGVKPSELSLQAAAYLIEAGKTSELDSVMRDAQELRAQKYGAVEFTVRSAHELDNSQVEQVEKLAADQYPGTKNVTMHKVKDETVLGGANLTFPHSRLDITVRAKLNQLKEAIS